MLNKKSANVGLALIVCFTLSSCTSSVIQKNELNKAQWQNLLDKDLSQWDVWLGVPHTSVQGLPADTYKAENMQTNIGQPIGLNNDQKQVFRTIEENGEILLAVSGEIYGGLTTKQEYQNYHLKLQFKWGEKKWAPRLDVKRDSG